MHRKDYRKRGDVASVEPDTMRYALRQYASGVTVVTAELDDEQYGITVTAFASISLVPPMVMVSINNESPLSAAIISSEHFAVHLLSASQRNLAERFAQPVSSIEKYTEVPFVHAASGAPILSGSLATLDCILEQTLAVGSHTVMFGRVVHCERSDSDESPLVYHNRDYRSIT